MGSFGLEGTSNLLPKAGSAMSSDQVLETSSSHCTTSLGNLFHCATTLTAESVLRSEPLLLRVMPVVAYITHRFEEPSSISLLTSLKEVEGCCSGHLKPSLLQALLLLAGQVFKFPHHHGGRPPNSLNLINAFLDLGCQTLFYKQHKRCWAEGIIALAVLLLVEPTVGSSLLGRAAGSGLPCRFPRRPGPIQQSNPSPPSLHHWKGLLLPKNWNSHFPFLNFMRFPLAHSSSLTRSP